MCTKRNRVVIYQFCQYSVQTVLNAVNRLFTQQVFYPLIISANLSFIQTTNNSVASLCTVYGHLCYIQAFIHQSIRSSIYLSSDTTTYISTISIHASTQPSILPSNNQSIHSSINQSKRVFVSTIKTVRIVMHLVFRHCSINPTARCHT